MKNALYLAKYRSHLLNVSINGLFMPNLPLDPVVSHPVVRGAGYYYVESGIGQVPES